jgi:hypothetical protein
MLSAFERGAVVAAAVAAIALTSGPACADESADGSYGRLEGDVTLAGGLGAVLAARGVRAEAELRVRYLESIGVFGTYEDGKTFASPAEPGRVVAVGVEARPMFLYRWLTGNESLRPRMDLAADSIALELAATWSQPEGQGFASLPGIQVSIGLEVPLLARADGPWVGLHGGVRWSDVALASGVLQTADDRAAFVAFTLAWHQVVLTHAVDVGDQRPR